MVRSHLLLRQLLLPLFRLLKMYRVMIRIVKGFCVGFRARVSIVAGAYITYSPNILLLLSHDILQLIETRPVPRARQIILLDKGTIYFFMRLQIS